MITIFLKSKKIYQKVVMILFLVKHIYALMIKMILVVPQMDITFIRIY